jgi:hypothetical protein
MKSFEKNKVINQMHKTNQKKPTSSLSIKDVVPENIFDSVHKSKSTLKSSQSKPKNDKNDNNSDSDSDSAIDVEDTYINDSYSFSEDESDSEDSDKKSSELDTECFDTTKPPVYDGIEPYFMFKRRWDNFIQNKESKRIYVKILEFLNRLFSAKYTNLKSIKKITLDLIPTPKKFIDIMTSSDQNYVQIFKIRYSQSIPTFKMLDNLLAKVNFSLVMVDTGKELYYSIKPKSSSSSSIRSSIL